MTIVIHCIFTGSVLLFGISGGEILILLLLVLILFGPSKIPEIARMLGRGINEVKKVQREINTEIHRYSSEIEKETTKMQSEIDDIKKQVAQNLESTEGDGKKRPLSVTGEDKADALRDPAAARRREPRPDAYEEALANDPRKPKETQEDQQEPAEDGAKSRQESKKTTKETDTPEQKRADEIRESMGDPGQQGGQDQVGKQDQPDSDDDDLPYPYGKRKQDAVD
jgi:TatA/E family protein of Tat protein translocase